MILASLAHLLTLLRWPRRTLPRQHILTQPRWRSQLWPPKSYHGRRCARWLQPRAKEHVTFKQLLLRPFHVSAQIIINDNNHYYFYSDTTSSLLARRTMPPTLYIVCRGHALQSDS